MFIEKYINDFDERLYIDYLTNPNKLGQLADAYIHQFDNPTYDCTIAFKESLDHYVAKQYLNNPTFINDEKCKNYMIYLNNIFSKRVSVGNNQLEYNTNIIFQNEKLKNAFLSFYSPDVKLKLETIINDNNSLIDSINKQIKEGKELSQHQLNFIAEYYYTKRDLDDINYSKFIEYLLNNDNTNITNSPQIIASYIAYLPKIYGDGCEYSRAILSNGIAKSRDLENIILPNEIERYKGMKKLKKWGFYSHGDKYISMGWDFLRNVNLNTDLSLNISRTMAGNSNDYLTEEEKEEAKKYNDLYWVSMTTFHEMTHQLQNNSMMSKEFNSSGFAQLIKIVRNNVSDNVENHDSIESEIEADEVAWSKMYSFIAKFRLKSQNPNLVKDTVETQLKKCLINKETVFARRSIRTKKYKESEDFFATDIKEINNKMNDPVSGNQYKKNFIEIIKRYPMFGKIFDENGNIKTNILFEINFTSKNKFGNDENIMACEISNYILSDGYNTLKYHLINDDLSKEQVTNLMMNVYNTYHLQKKYVNSLSKIDFSQLKETETNFNYNDQTILISKYLEKFKNVASLVYKERELVSIINKKYPQYNIEQISDPKYAYWNYQDMFNHLYNISSGIVKYDDLKNIIEAYEKSGDPVLEDIATQTKKSVIDSDIKLDSGFKSL